MLFAIILITGYHYITTHFLFRWRKLWQTTRFQLSYQDSELINQFINLIPSQIPGVHKQNQADFTRNRSLPFNRLITLVLSMAASGTNQGVDPKAGLFFKNARRSGLWPDANATDRSSISKARSKIKWQVFDDILADAVKLAYRIWPKDDARYSWNDMSVFAIDGSRFRLPASDSLRTQFDHLSGLEHQGKGHYPQCLVSTIYDVFRRLPIARTVVHNDSCERQEMKNLTPFVPGQQCMAIRSGVSRV